VRLLLRYRADPWRPTIGGRSPGEVALWGPLADLFADLPGAPKIPAADRDRQARADALIASYAWADQWSVGGGGIAFIHGVPADEVIRRFGGDPAGCPLIDAAAFGELTVASLAEPQPPATPEPVWVADVPGGAVAVQQLGCLLTRREVAAPVSRGGVLGSAFAGGNGAITVHIARDGQYVRWAGPIYDPKVGYGEPLEEERWCRFGAPDAPADSMAQCLALMTMLTGRQHRLIDGFTPEQRFFLAWAQIWRGNITPEAQRVRINTDPHSPGQWRTNGPLSNLRQFAAAFSCKPGDPMVRPDSVRPVIW